MGAEQSDEALAWCSGCDEPVLFEEAGEQLENCTCESRADGDNLGELFG